MVASTFADSAGFLAVLAFKLKPSCGAAALPAGSSLRFYDRFAFPVGRLVDAAGVRFLFGENPLAVGRKG
jgi:hypothetical protein